MFFKRRKKKGAGSKHRTGYEDLRRFYRRVPNRKHALGAMLMRGPEPPLAAEVADVSAGGVRVVFNQGADPTLPAGFETTVRISSLVHEGGVEAAARLLRKEGDEDERVYYAFEFQDLGHLFSQVDTFWAKFFNRRRAGRVRPALGRRTKVSALAPAGETEVALQDVSLFGAGLSVSREVAPSLYEIPQLQLEFDVPSQDQRFSCQAHLRHATVRGNAIVLGYEFEDPQSQPAIGALKKFIAGREDEMRQWEEAS